MATDVEIERTLATVSATINDRQLEEFDRDRFQAVVDEALGGERKLTVDDGGGLHDESGTRIAAIRQNDAGRWLVERQNSAADQSDVAIPTAPPQSKLRKLLTKLQVRSS